MALNPETYQEFQRQIELQKEESQRNKDAGSKIKVDEDGTEYEWDESKKAWFPKLSVETVMKYQENYTAGEDASQSAHSYVDPTTNITFLWNSEKSKWEPKTSEDGQPCRYTDPNGTSYVWNTESGKWALEGGDNAQNGEKSDSLENTDNLLTNHTYTHPITGSIYKWNYQRQLWVSDSGEIMHPSTSNQNNATSFTDPKSGVVYNWDKEKGEWVVQNKEKGKKGNTKRKATEPTWFKAAEEKNTNVYVQGLPPDISLEEFETLMLKCGIIKQDPHTGKPKVKLYKDREGNLKGDGLCCYLKKESLDLALQLLDESTMRGGYKIHVQKADFQLKGAYDPLKKPKMLSKKEKAQIKKEQEKLLDWKLARKETQKKSERVLIFKHMFDPKDFEEDATLITDIRDDLRKECEKFGGVKKVIVFDRHPEGVCSVAFKDFDEAAACIEAMNGRWFAKREISVAPWDGVTDYQVEETDKEREVRMKNWEKFLVEGKEETKKESAES